MSNTVSLTRDNFEEYLRKDGVLLVDWWAPWCGPCKTFGPIFEEAAQRYGDVVFAKINTDEQPDLASAFEIRSIPTLMAFRDRVLLFQRPGVLPGEALDELVTKVKQLDMEDVRRQIAQAKAARGAEAEKAADGDAAK